MSQNEVMTTSPTGAMKAENDERYDLIPVEPLRLLAQHYGRGAKKYADRNWEKGIEWHKHFASANRHMQQFWGGEDIDEETGSPHVISAAWHMFALAFGMDNHPELDDRPTTVQKVLEVQSGCATTEFPMKVERLDQQWQRAYIWTSSLLEYHWLRNGHKGDGWYWRDSGDWKWSGENERPGSQGPFERLP